MYIIGATVALIFCLWSYSNDDYGWAVWFALIAGMLSNYGLTAGFGLR